MRFLIDCYDPASLCEDIPSSITAILLKRKIKLIRIACMWNIIGGK